MAQNQTSVNHSLSYGRFLRATILFCTCLGLLVGLFGLFGSLFGGHVFFRFGPLYINGITAGLLAIPVWSIIGVLFGTVIGSVTFVPINWFYRQT